MKKATLSLVLTLCLLAMAIVPAFAEVTIDDMPKVDLTDKVVSMYFWGDSYENYGKEGLEPWQQHTFEKVYGGQLKVVQSSGDYYENLYALMTAGDCPDVILAHDNTFPSFIMNGIAQPAEDFIYTDNAIWSEIRDLEDMKQMEINGHIYCVTTAFHGLGVLFYNERILEEAGLDMPVELWKNGEWTWDKFSEYMIDLTQDTDRDGLTDIYGMAYGSDFYHCWFGTTGVDMIDFVDGKFVNLLKDERITAAADFLYNHGPMGEDVFLEGDPTDLLVNGKVAMGFTNDWRLYYNLAELEATDGLGVVPLPQSPFMDSCVNSTIPDYWYILKDAKNPVGAGLFLLCNRYDDVVNVDPSKEKLDARETYIQSVMKEGSGCSREDAEVLYVINRELPSVLLTSRYISIDRSELLSTPWTTIADSIYEATNQKIIDAMTPAVAE